MGLELDKVYKNSEVGLKGGRQVILYPRMFQTSKIQGKIILFPPGTAKEDKLRPKGLQEMWKALPPNSPPEGHWPELSWQCRIAAL